jgi:2-succinyl-5-enolpyruvyl-6-hydroxy-3-cyclohexene-1-carboxylate synthase
MNPSTALATVLVAALADLGVRNAVLCPGSRSAPLAYALAEAAQRDRIGLHVRIDERSAGFLALGFGLADPQTPAAVITTSGTAVANLHPAVLEAAHAGVPLLVLSADRPHELRGAGASQTTDQVKLFGSAVRWFGEIPAPASAATDAQAAGWRNVVARAVASARGSLGHAPGPVHLNVAFADPLTPDGDGPQDWPQSLTGPAGLTAVQAASVGAPTSLPFGPNTVVLAGDGAGPAAAQLGQAAGWPLLAEPSSGVRAYATCAPYRLLLERPELGGRIERVVVYGRPTLSRPVTRLLARSDVEVIVVSPRPDWADATRRASLVVPAAAVDAANDSLSDQNWLREWDLAGKVATAGIDELLDAEAAAGRLTGQLIAREIAAATGSADVLVAGSSNPIRDLDLVARLDPGARVLSNRGLAGIDGTLSTASGVALALTSTAGQVRALVGDLTFLHDAGGLLIGRYERRPDLQIIVVDDDGGGIFSGLEHGARAELGDYQSTMFERIFGTPQRVDLAALCAGYGVTHTLLDDVAGLRAGLAAPPSGLSVLQIRVDRTAHRVLSHRLRQAALDSPGSAG